MSDDFPDGDGGENNGNGPGDSRNGSRPKPSDSAKLDVIFDVLTNTRRRYALYYLQRQDGPVSLSTLARQLAAWEAGVEPEAVDEEHHRRMYTELYHIHLPKLEDAGIVDYDERTGTVRFWKHATLLQNVLRVATWLDRPNS